MYDAIVVGARCAGASTARLLARLGHRVLLLDKIRFPSDTLSTLYIQPNGVDCLARWGLLDAVVEAGTPAIEGWSWRADDVVLEGFPFWDGSECRPGFAPRRSVLDEILVRAARDAGVEVREDFLVEELQFRDGAVSGIKGRSRGTSAAVSECARIVIGADGRHSVIANRVNAASYDERPPLTCVYYGFFSGIRCSKLEQYAYAGKGLSLIPTNHDSTLVAFVLPDARLAEIIQDPKAFCYEALRGVADLEDRVQAGVLQGRLVGMGNLRNFYRRAHGPGWALVGDAGHARDPITGHGISDAFRDAEFLANAIHEWLAGAESFASAMGRYEDRRDRAGASAYQWTLRVAELRPLGARIERLLVSIRDDPELVALFMGLNAGTVASERFFALPRVVERGRSAGKARAS